MPLMQPSEDDRQSVLAEVERLHYEYLDATREFERVLHLVPGDDEHPGVMKSVLIAAEVRKLAFNRYLAAAAEAAR